MGIKNLLRPTKRWPDYVADVEAAIMRRPPAEQERIFGLFRNVGGLLTTLPDDVGKALVDAIVITVVKFGPGHRSADGLLDDAEKAAPRLAAAIRSYANTR